MVRARRAHGQNRPWRPLGGTPAYAAEENAAAGSRAAGAHPARVVALGGKCSNPAVASNRPSTPAATGSWCRVSARRGTLGKAQPPPTPLVLHGLIAPHDHPLSISIARARTSTSRTTPLWCVFGVNVADCSAGTCGCVDVGEVLDLVSGASRRKRHCPAHHVGRQARAVGHADEAAARRHRHADRAICPRS